LVSMGILWQAAWVARLAAVRPYCSCVTLASIAVTYNRRITNAAAWIGKSKNRAPTCGQRSFVKGGDAYSFPKAYDTKSAQPSPNACGSICSSSVQAVQQWCKATLHRHRGGGADDAGALCSSATEQLTDELLEKLRPFLAGLDITLTLHSEWANVEVYLEGQFAGYAKVEQCKQRLTMRGDLYDALIARERRAGLRCPLAAWRVRAGGLRRARSPHLHRNGGIVNSLCGPSLPPQPP
jgi:hypothetical protein